MPSDNTLQQLSAPYHAVQVQNLASALRVDFSKGLSEEEATSRRKIFGPNVLPEGHDDTYLDVLVRQIASPLAYILLFAAFLSLSLRHFSDLVIILITISVNVAVGFIQEIKANNALKQLRKAIETRAVVVREGRTRQISSSDVVRGDILLVRAGARIPADARLIEAQKLEVVESELTGESVPALKSPGILSPAMPLADRDNMLYMGTEVAAGWGRAVVVETGPATEVGKIAGMIANIQKQQTPLQKSLGSSSRALVWFTLSASFILLAIGLFQGRDFLEMLEISVAVAVAAIPEGLLISMTAILAVGMQRILRKRGLARHMMAAETLGATSVICTDKTGTLTLGEMRVASLVSGMEELHVKKHLSEAKQSEEYLKILRTALFVNEAVVENPEDEPGDWKIIGNLTDKALLVASSDCGLGKDEADKKYPEISRLPFDEKRKYAASLRKYNAGNNMVFVKGAAEVILKYSSSIDVNGASQAANLKTLDELNGKFLSLTQKGLRVLGVAYRKVNATSVDFEASEDLVNKLTFVGFIGLRDPIREEVPASIASASAAGVRPVIVTGDHKNTAMAIAREAGMKVSDANVLEGRQIDDLGDSELRAAVPGIQIFARVTPAHKLRIIDAWQARGEVVAMTGDGVNDAPALKKADIGVSMSSGTEVAQAASDLVLLDNDFKTIVAAIREGRIIFNNIRKVILFLLSDSFQEIILISGALILGLPAPLLPAQILWNNLITDGVPNLALTFEPGDGSEMKAKPRRKNEPLVSKEMKILILVVGVVSDLVFLLIFLSLYSFLDLGTVRTMVFAAFGLSSLLYVFSLRNLRLPVWKIPFFNNPSLILAVAAGIGLQIMAVYVPALRHLLGTVPLAWNLWLVVGGLAAIKLVAIEITKAFFRASRPVV